MWCVEVHGYGEGEGEAGLFQDSFCNGPEAGRVIPGGKSIQKRGRQLMGWESLVPPLRPTLPAPPARMHDRKQGVEFTGAPDVGDAPLIADMSSNFLSKPVDVSK